MTQSGSDGWQRALLALQGITWLADFIEAEAKRHSGPRRR